jgi:hypothetical protein
MAYELKTKSDLLVDFLYARHELHMHLPETQRHAGMRRHGICADKINLLLYYGIK